MFDSSIIINEPQPPTPQPNLEKAFRTFSPLKCRLTVHIDSPNFISLCKIIKKIVIDPLLSSRNSNYFEKCCWSFTKPTKVKCRDLWHDDRVHLNKMFPSKEEDDAAILTCLKDLLITSAEQAGYLNDKAIPIPYLNLPHHKRSSPDLSQFVLQDTLQAELELLRKRDPPAYELANPITQAIDGMKAEIGDARNSFTRLETSLDSLKGDMNRWTVMWNKSNQHLDNNNKRIAELEADNKKKDKEMSGLRGTIDFLEEQNKFFVGRIATLELSMTDLQGLVKGRFKDMARPTYSLQRY